LILIVRMHGGGIVVGGASLEVDGNSLDSVRAEANQGDGDVYRSSGVWMILD
jgi:hypothetical protein